MRKAVRLATEQRRYIIHVPCDRCPEGYHARYQAAPWVPWSSEKVARRHIGELLAEGFNVDGWEVVEYAEAAPSNA
jgi:hypothetical protein